MSEPRGRTQEEIDHEFDDDNEYDLDVEDDLEDCGMMANGQCMLAGTEFCDWDCPHDRPVRRRR